MRDAAEAFFALLGVIFVFIASTIMFGIWLGAIAYFATGTYNWLNDTKIEGVRKNVKTV